MQFVINVLGGDVSQCFYVYLLTILFRGRSFYGVYFPIFRLIFVQNFY